MEMVVNGVSTRDVAKVTEQLCGTSFSKSTVSDLCKRLDPLVQAWNHRSRAEHRYPFLLVDALVLRIREDGRIRSRAALIAVGVNDEGYREILGLMLGNSEYESSWREFFAWLKQRGLSGVRIGRVRQSPRTRQGTSDRISGLHVATVPDPLHAQSLGRHTQGVAGGGLQTGPHGPGCA